MQPADPELEQLLVDMVEVARDVPRSKRTWFLSRTDQEDLLRGPWGTRPILASDVMIFEEAGLITVTGRWIGGVEFIISHQGLQQYAEIKRRQAPAMQRTEEGVRRFLDSEPFREAYPAAHARWSDAEALLWGANSEREFTTVGHKVREAMQEFATEALGHYQPPEFDSDPSKVNRRLGAVIAMLLPSLGEARATLLRALGDYSEALMDLIQRQEHGGQKEGQALTWQDARRVVFHTASVMYEFAVSLNEADTGAPPPAVLEGGN